MAALRALSLAHHLVGASGSLPSCGCQPRPGDPRLYALFPASFPRFLTPLVVCGALLLLRLRTLTIGGDGTSWPAIIVITVLPLMNRLRSVATSAYLEVVLNHILPVEVARLLVSHQQLLFALALSDFAVREGCLPFQLVGHGLLLVLVELLDLLLLLEVLHELDLFFRENVLGVVGTRRAHRERRLRLLAQEPDAYVSVQRPGHEVVDFAGLLLVAVNGRPIHQLLMLFSAE